MNSKFGMKGFGVIRLLDADGAVKHQELFNNLITTAGDLYYATRAAAAVAPLASADATKVTGMKLGTGSTTPAKSGGAAALGTYVSASNLVFAATYPTVAAIGSDVGYRLTYFVSWGPGVATNSALSEAVIVNDAAADATSVEANTIARVTFTGINKLAGDTLQISWAHDFLGA